MYVNPFWFGVLTGFLGTVGAFILFIIYACYKAGGGK